MTQQKIDSDAAALDPERIDAAVGKALDELEVGYHRREAGQYLVTFTATGL